MKKILALAISVVLILAIFTSCSAQSKLVGTWNGKQDVLIASIDVEYTFNKDGTGTELVYNTGIPFTYTVEKDKLTIIKGTDIVNKEEYTFSVEKNVLTLTSQNDKVLTLTKAD